MDRELSSSRIAPFQLVSVIDINIVHSKKRECLEIHSQFSSMKFVPVRSKPSYAWKDVSEKVQANHSAPNIRVRAIPALIPMKDKLHRMLHRKCGCGQKDSAKELDSAEEQRSTPEEPTESPLGAELSESDVCEASHIQLMDWAVSERHASMQLQKISLECSSDCLAKLSQFVSNNLSLLIVHKFGNYLVQNCTTRNTLLRKYVKSYCESNFGRLIKDQFGSRVLQVLVQESNSFRKKLMEVFKTELGVYLRSISAVPLQRRIGERHRHSVFGFEPQTLAAREVLQEDLDHLHRELQRRAAGGRFSPDEDDPEHRRVLAGQVHDDSDLQADRKKPQAHKAGSIGASQVQADLVLIAQELQLHD